MLMSFQDGCLDSLCSFSLPVCSRPICSVSIYEMRPEKSKWKIPEIKYSPALSNASFWIIMMKIPPFSSVLTNISIIFLPCIHIVCASCPLVIKLSFVLFDNLWHHCVQVNLFCWTISQSGRVVVVMLRYVSKKQQDPSCENWKPLI